MRGKGGKGGKETKRRKRKKEETRGSGIESRYSL
jgi:hypothetical protein